MPAATFGPKHAAATGTKISAPPKPEKPRTVAATSAVSATAKKSGSERKSKLGTVLPPRASTLAEPLDTLM